MESVKNYENQSNYNKELPPDGMYEIDNYNHKFINKSTGIHYEDIINWNVLESLESPFGDTSQLFIVGLFNGNNKVFISRYPVVSYSSILKYDKNSIFNIKEGD